MGTAARRLEIQYGNATVAPDGALRIEHTYERFVVEFDVVIAGISETNLNTNAGIFENEYREPYQDLTITLDHDSGTVTLWSFKESDNTGLNIMPSIRKLGGPKDTAKTRSYRCRVEVALPPDSIPARVGRRHSSVDIAADGSNRYRVTISGIWTAVGANNARTQYEAQVNAYCASVLTALRGTSSASPQTTDTWELLEHSMDLEDTDDSAKSTGKVLSFRRVYAELIPTEGQAGATNDLDIVGQSFSMRRRAPSGLNSMPNINALLEVDVSYEASIDKEQTTDLVGKWATIRSWILGRVGSVIGGTAMLQDDTPEYHWDSNRITASMTVLVAVSGSTIIEITMTTEDVNQTGWVLIPVLNGDPDAKFAYQGPGEKTRVVTEMRRAFGVAPFKGGVSFDDLYEIRGEGQVIDRKGVSITPQWIGRSDIADAAQSQAYVMNRRIVVKFFNIPPTVKIQGDPNSSTTVVHVPVAGVEGVPEEFMAS